MYRSVSRHQATRVKRQADVLQQANLHRRATMPAKEHAGRRGFAALAAPALCLAAAVSASAGCAADDALSEGAEARTTVHEAALLPADEDRAADSADPARSSDPDSPAGNPDDPGSASAGATPTAIAAPLFGDLDAVEIAAEVLVVLDQPIDAATAPNGEWWVTERGGRVLVVDPASGAVGDTVIDISSETAARGERGLLGIAVDDAAVYLNFTDRSGDTRVDAWLLDESGRPGERHGLLSVDQPYANHNGGGLAIGPDGLLYVGMGDGGRGGDPHGHGQNPDTLLGAILRVRPAPGAADPYEIPADNPYAGGGGAPEAFLIGVRNPWRFSFDPVNGNLWVADVGQDAVEEITLLAGASGWGIGANLGWSLREGTLRYRGDRPAGNVDPVFEYYHGGDPDGCSVSGGHVYRGAAVPELVGSYVFGDYCTSRIWALSIAEGTPRFRDLGVPVPGGELAGFAVDPEGELLALSLNGQVSRIIPA